MAPLTLALRSFATYVLTAHKSIIPSCNTVQGFVVTCQSSSTTFAFLTCSTANGTNFSERPFSASPFRCQLSRKLKTSCHCVILVNCSGVKIWRVVLLQIFTSWRGNDVLLFEPQTKHTADAQQITMWRLRSDVSVPEHTFGAYSTAHPERSNVSQTTVPFQISAGMKKVSSADGLLFCRLTQKKLESVNAGT